MGKIRDYILKLKQIKADIKKAIEDKGVDAGDDMTKYGEKIGEIYYGLGIVHDWSITVGWDCRWNKTIVKIIIPPNWTPPTNNISNFFAVMPNLREIEGLENINLTNVYNADKLFYGSPNIANTDYSGLDFEHSNINHIDGLFRENFTNVPEVTFPDIPGRFTGMSYLWTLGAKTINIRNWNFENWTSGSFIAGNITHINVLEGGKGMYNIKRAFSIFKELSLDRESAIIILNGLYDYSGSSTTYTVTLSATTKALLTEDDIAIATSKGWTIA